MLQISNYIMHILYHLLHIIALHNNNILPIASICTDYTCEKQLSAAGMNELENMNKSFKYKFFTYNNKYITLEI